MLIDRLIFQDLPPNYMMCGVSQSVDHLVAEHVSATLIGTDT